MLQRNPLQKSANTDAIDDGSATKYVIDGTSNYDDHCNDPSNGCQDVENVDTDIPAERKLAKPLCRVVVSSFIGTLGLVCVCDGGGEGNRQRRERRRE